MWIIDKRQKTGTQFRVKLLPVAKQLVEQYSRLQLPDDKVFPVKDDNSMNMSLRHVARQPDFLSILRRIRGAIPSPRRSR